MKYTLRLGSHFLLWIYGVCASYLCLAIRSKKMKTLSLVLLFLIMPLNNQAARTAATLMPEILPAAMKATKSLSSPLESNATLNKVKPKLMKPKPFSTSTTTTTTEVTTAELTDCTDGSTTEETTTVESTSPGDSTTSWTSGDEGSDELPAGGKKALLPSPQQQVQNASLESEGSSQGKFKTSTEASSTNHLVSAKTSASNYHFNEVKAYSPAHEYKKPLSTNNLITFQTSPSSVSTDFHSYHVKAYSPAHEYNKLSSHNSPDHPKPDDQSLTGPTTSSSAERDISNNHITEAYSYGNASKNVSVDIDISINIGFASENSTSKPRHHPGQNKRLAAQQEVVVGLFLMVVISISAVGALFYVAAPARRRLVLRRRNSDLVELLAGRTNKYRPVRKYYDSTMHM